MMAFDWVEYKCDATPLLVSPPLENSARPSKDYWGYCFSRQLAFAVGVSGDYLIPRGECREAGGRLYGEVLRRGFPRVLEDYRAKYVAMERALESAGNMDARPESELIALLSRACKAYGDVYSVSGMIEPLQIWLEAELNKLVAASPAGLPVTQIISFVVLISGEAFHSRQERELLELLGRCQADAGMRACLDAAKTPRDLLGHEGLARELERHSAAWHWLRNSYAHTARLSPGDFAAELLSLHACGKPASQLLAARLQRRSELEGERDAALAKLADRRISELALFAGELAFWQDDRKTAALRSVVVIDEVAARLAGLKGLDAALVKLAFPREVAAGLLDDAAFRRELEARRKAWYCEYTVDGLFIESGDAALRKRREFFAGSEQVDCMEFEGTCACAGSVVGRARVVKTFAELGSMRKGEVLVAAHTRPEFFPAMKKAVAVVTDEGGITCHAAIVSRELGIPCVIGARIATRVVKTGDLIEVKASHGRVKILERGVVERGVED